MTTLTGPVMDGMFPAERAALAGALFDHLNTLANLADPEVTDRGRALRSAAQALVWHTPTSREYPVVCLTAWELAHIWGARLRRDGVIL